MKTLLDQVALVTGGGSGIGWAIVQSLHAQGMKVSFCGRDEAKLRRAESVLKSKSDRILAMRADVSDRDQARHWVDLSLRQFGRIDLLVNNAGVAQFSDVETMAEDHLDFHLNNNLKGPLYCAQAVIPQMKRQQGGTIINISSILGKVSYAGTAAYAASKFGLMALSDSLREELVSHHVKVTAICPGYVATPMVADAPVPQTEMIQPEDIANTVLYLLRLTDHATVKEVVINRPIED